MAVTPAAAAVIAATFPANLKADLDVVLGRLPPAGWAGQVEGKPVTIEGEQIRLLSRFYSPEPTEGDVEGLTERQRRLLASLYSWHHDGHVRERWMTGLRGDEPWLPLFVLRLVGDYIEPIWDRALDNIGQIPRERYEAFARENPAFISVTRDRIVSYHLYVGRQRRDFLDNPAYRFMFELGLWNGTQARGWVAHARKLREEQSR